MSRAFGRTLAALMASAAASLLVSVSGGTATAATEPADDDSRSPVTVESISAPVADTAAAGAAINTRGLWLKFPTSPNSEACTSRRIDLAADSYKWMHQHGGHVPGGFAEYDMRNLYLAAGWYVWKDCIFAPSTGSTYYHDTYLRRESTGGYAHLDRVRLWTSTPGTFWVEFGSTLSRR